MSSVITSSITSVAGSLQQALGPVAHGLARSLTGARLPQSAPRFFSASCTHRSQEPHEDQDEAEPRFLVTGAGGQIGTELLHYLRCGTNCRLRSTMSTQHELRAAHENYPCGQCSVRSASCSNPLGQEGHVPTTSGLKFIRHGESAGTTGMPVNRYTSCAPPY